MRGLLVVNAFLNTKQTEDTYDLLLAGAKRAGIQMELVTNAQFFTDAGDGHVESDIPGFYEMAYDFILFWNKDVFLGRALERMGYRLYNSADAIEACDNKAVTFERLEGVCRTPRTIKVPMTFNNVGYDDLSFEEYLGNRLGYPYVIKECLGSYGGQVYLANDSESARRILKDIEGRDCLAQEFISSSSGRDIRAYVVGRRVVAAMERVNDNDFRSNIANGGRAVAHRVTKEQEEMAVLATEKLGLDFAGVDLLIGEGGEPILCEVNSNAQFRGLLNATGIDITDELFAYISSGLNTCKY
ncbi:MAG: RimK family alpha-L-glutamate ligase [Lachnospiraceae bacterium]|nr:RimK family alpha-L-glutamate ligase [Lachnospiraceae bacterium]